MARCEPVPDSVTLLTKWFPAALAAPIDAISAATHAISTSLRWARTQMESRTIAPSRSLWAVCHSATVPAPLAHDRDG